MKSLTVCILLLVISSSYNTAFAQQRKPVSIIFDTDMGPDYDDVGAIALLHAMADSGECTILATIASNTHPYIAAVLQVLNTYFKRPGIPIGMVHGPSVHIAAAQKWDSLLAAHYPHTITDNSQATDAVILYRKLLAAQPDKSVTIVTVGFLTNMANLLQSAPDNLSPLSGSELIERKVKQLVSMAGVFDSSMGTFKEFNVMKDAAASVIAFSNWPTPIVFSGFEIGWRIHTGLPLVNSPAITNSPVKEVFAHSMPMDPNDKNGRASWDETAVLVAVRGYEKYFDVAKGRFVCHADGTNGWNKNGQRDAYLLQKMPIAELEAVLNGLIMHQPTK